jgi:hypothetical protein
MIVKARNALARCRKFTSTRDGNATTFDVTGLSFRTLATARWRFG